MTNNQPCQHWPTCRSIFEHCLMLVAEKKRNLPPSTLLRNPYRDRTPDELAKFPEQDQLGYWSPSPQKREVT